MIWPKRSPKGFPNPSCRWHEHEQKPVVKSFATRSGPQGAPPVGDPLERLHEREPRLVADRNLCEMGFGAKRAVPSRSKAPAPCEIEVERDGAGADARWKLSLIPGRPNQRTDRTHH